MKISQNFIHIVAIFAIASLTHGFQTAISPLHHGRGCSSLVGPIRCHRRPLVTIPTTTSVPIINSKVSSRSFCKFTNFQPSLVVRNMASGAAESLNGESDENRASNAKSQRLRGGLNCVVSVI
jgi:hypothetical protein